MNDLTTVLSSLAFGLGSSLVPVLNAEAFVLAAVAAHPWLVVPVVTGLAFGQTCGKLMIFEAALRGVDRFTQKHRKPGRLHALSQRLMALMSNRRHAVPVVFLAASAGLPPLALVSIAAGAAHQSRAVFAVTCFIGRTVRFAILAIPVLALFD